MLKALEVKEKFDQQLLLDKQQASDETYLTTVPRESIRGRSKSIFPNPSTKSIQIVEHPRVSTPRGSQATKQKRSGNPFEKKADYAELSESLKYPHNRAYYKKSAHDSDNQIVSFLDYCRKNRIPLNKSDSTLYNMVRTNETY